VGASLRGTLPVSEFQEIAYGSRRDERHFSFTISTPERYTVPQYHITERPIDALSRAALIQRVGERGEYVFLSNDSYGELPKRQIEEGLVRQALVHCSFDNDAGGNKLWQQVKETYLRRGPRALRPPAGAKDWNDAQRAAPGRAEGPGEDDRAPSRSRGRAPGRDEPSRG